MEPSGGWYARTGVVERAYCCTSCAVRMGLEGQEQGGISGRRGGENSILQDMLGDEVGDVVKVPWLHDGVVVVALGEFLPDLDAGTGEIVEAFHMGGSAGGVSVAEDCLE